MKILHGVTKELTEDGNEVFSELQSMHDFFLHIDADATFCGLRPITDGKSMMWTGENGSKLLQEESDQEINPEYLQNLVRSLKG